MSEQLSNARLVKRLLFTVAAMFAFGFALVPLYDVLCDVLGINGKTNTSAYQPSVEQIDESRTLRVQFLSTNADGMTWSFGPDADELTLHPGETREMLFHARNPTDHAMVAQAIPSVAPSKAAAYFHKTECFCFTQQVLQPGESVEMPVRFIVDPALPADVKHLTLAYTLFDVTDRMPEKLAGSAPQAN
ncbi:MAG: cytochrome c oxidase assembly protein [Halopseudomonas sp.]|uniref:cytochrome c oxidase assembly protein n=1 Tax=Halopseudomonas sp. TaxID=2901191 RepID=UPI0030030EC7